MKKLYMTLVAALFAAAASMRAPAPAAAGQIVPIEIPASGDTIIGVVTIAGLKNIVAVTKAASNGTCYLRYIFKNTDKLLGDHVVSGTTVGDYILNWSGSDYSFCGYNIRKLTNYQGYFLQLMGDEGNDSILPSQLGWEFVYGEGGNDRIMCSSKGSTWGGTGNDIMKCNGSAGGYLLANEGDDQFCAYLTDPNATVQRMDGGDGTDSSCGKAGTRINVEKTNCSDNINVCGYSIFYLM